MTDLLWVHIDALGRGHPVWDAAGEAHAVFVWDADDLARRGWTLKRCVFVMECVESLGVEVIEGRAGEVLAGLAPSRLFMAQTPDPALNAAAEASGAEVQVIADAPFSDVPRTTDMGRFFRFWNAAKRSALSPTAELRG